MEDVAMDYPEMKDRISHIIRAKNLTAAEFAIQLGIQPSNVSHLLSGRNNPSLDFVKKLKETFPEYNLDWIVMGQGPITVSDSFKKPVAETLSVGKQESSTEQSEIVEDFQGTLFDAQNMVEAKEEKPIVTSKAVLKKIIMVYSDHTFEEMLPR